ncbi:unnamed protein product [Pieris macdunnoughi]|uniref:Lipocalin/cytosolic fatty-acid binding domain-containing protein n=1 Tax=Pieris macdunnoughi TaxID=345717 RepID=A0A821RMD6_9NEOP|nr:unnamed protein product [Pieris macdunnoughi]
MYTFILISLFLANTVKSEVNGKYCEGFKTDFDIKKAIGRWHVVAVIPDTNFSNKFDNVTCYRVDFSEVDEASLKWMITQRLGRPTEQLMDSEPGEVIRLRYHTEQPFDIWSKSVRDLKGCYRQLIDLKNNETDIHLANTLDSPMLLHVLETGYGPFLLQMLWGRLAAVIYRREPCNHFNSFSPDLVPVFSRVYRIEKRQRLSLNRSIGEQRASELYGECLEEFSTKTCSGVFSYWSRV